VALDKYAVYTALTFFWVILVGLNAKALQKKFCRFFIGSGTPFYAPNQNKMIRCT